MVAFYISKMLLISNVISLKNVAGFWCGHSLKSKPDPENIGETLNFCHFSLFLSSIYHIETIATEFRPNEMSKNGEIDDTGDKKHNLIVTTDKTMEKI